jgi:hypothetical protein
MYKGVLVCIIHAGFWGPVEELISTAGGEPMPADTGQERLNMKMLALFLIGGSLGAIVMSWIAYSAMVAL